MTKMFRLKNLECANCAMKMENAIKKLNGVNSASVNFLTQKLMIDAVEEQFETIMQEVVKICHKIEPDCKVIM